MDLTEKDLIKKNTINIQQWEKVRDLAQAGDMTDNPSYYPGKIKLSEIQIAELEDKGRIKYFTKENIDFDGFPVDIEHEGIYVIPKEGFYEEYINTKNMALNYIIETIKRLTEEQLAEINQDLKGIRIEVLKNK